MATSILNVLLDSLVLEPTRSVGVTGIFYGWNGGETFLQQLKQQNNCVSLVPGLGPWALGMAVRPCAKPCLLPSLCFNWINVCSASYFQKNGYDIQEDG